MKLRVLFFVIIIPAMALGQILPNEHDAISDEIEPKPVTPCLSCPVGQPGDEGDLGPYGETGLKGMAGSPGFLTYRGSPAECSNKCPKGKVGKEGYAGVPGEAGNDGMKGLTGHVGEKGYMGPSGQLGPQGQSNNVMYLPYKPETTFEHVCYSFRRSCYVPGLRNGWRSWFREGQSGFMVHKNWMYFVSLAQCPCNYTKPGSPQPVKPSNCLQGLC